MNRSGVRYITEDFIKISAHEDHLERIKRLNLDCGKEDKQIRYIEHLDNLTNLNVFSLRFHAIEKIEKFDKLVNLRELYLSENRISKLDGLENLLHLKILDVRGNNISTIPHWFTRRCKYLTKINMSYNLFDSIEEVSKLWNLKDLIDLDVSENPVASIAYYRSYIIMRLKFLQILDNREVLAEERKAAVEQFEENELDRLNSKLIDTTKQLEQMKENQIQLQKEQAQQENYKKDLHKKHKSSIEQIKMLEENLKSKDLLLKKKSEDLFRACQKYYELEQDIAFIKIDAKFDLLSNNIGSLEEPDNVSEHSQISSTGDQAYMGKGQFITKKEAEMLLERQRAKQKGQNEHEDKNSALKIKEDFLNSLNDKLKERLAELDQINQELSLKDKLVSKHDIDPSQRTIYPTKFGDFDSNRFDRPRSAQSSINRSSNIKLPFNRSKGISDNDLLSHPNSTPSLADQFLDKVENLTEMQKEAEKLRRQMESTEKESNRLQQDIGYLRSQMEKLKNSDPDLVRHIQKEVKDKELILDENSRLHENLSKHLDHLSEAMEKSMDDIRELESQLIEENHYFTEKMRQNINSALSQLSQSLPSGSQQDYRKILNKYRDAEAENQHLQKQVIKQQKEIEILQNEGPASSRRSARSIDDEVDVLRRELSQLRQDAMAAKDDLESEIEMEKVLNDELQKQVEELKRNDNEHNEEVLSMQEKHRKLIDKLKADQCSIQDSIEKQMINFQDDMLHRIKMASNPNQIANLEKSKNPIDKAIFHLLQSVEPVEKANVETTDSSVINKINEDLQQIKTDLNGMNRKISIDSQGDPMESLPVRSNSHKNRTISQTHPIKKMLNQSCRQYSNDMQDIKSRLKDLIDTFRQGSKFKKKRVISNKPLKSFQLPPTMIDETSGDYTSSDNHYPTFKPRSHSQDRIQRKAKPISSSAKKWTSLQQGVSSDEQAMFDAVQDELQDLIQLIDVAEHRNGQRIEHAMSHINAIEQQLQNQEKLMERDKKEYLDREKESLANHLRETMSQVEQCQDDIRRLNERLGNNIRITKLEDVNNDYAAELERMKIILQTQKAEIERLSGLLEKLCIPASSTFSQFAQTPLINNPPQPVEVPTFIPNSFLPNKQSSISTPLLNNGLSMNTEIRNAGSLFCNVPEHHFFEDYFQLNNNKRSLWKVKRKFKSESEKCLNTLDTLQDDIHKKNEELDNVEIQISKQTHEIRRLNYQIDQLNFTKRDLLDNISSLRHETEHMTRETIANTNDSLNHMRIRKNQLEEEIDKIELYIRDKRDELMRVENDVKNSRDYSLKVEEQTGETLRRYDEARLNHRKVILECEELEKRSKEAVLELTRAMNDLVTIRNEISGLSSNKINLEEILTKIQLVINEKDQDFQKLNNEINKASQHLISLQSNLNITTEQNREKFHMLSEGDQLISDTRLELNRLKNEIVQNQELLHRMESELGERSVSVNMVNQELERSRQVHHRIIQEHQNEQTKIKRELCDLKFDLDSMKDEKSDLMNVMESLKMKNLQMKDNIDKQEQTILVQKADLDKLSWQTQHNDNMVNMKQAQLNKIMSEYQANVIELEKSEEEIHQQQIEYKQLDADIKKKASELDKIRQSIAAENENLQRLQFDKANLEACNSNLTKEKNLIHNEKKELESNLKILIKQESQAHESLMVLEGKLSTARTELEKMYSEKCSETIKRDELKIQSHSISKQLHETKCELQSVKERISMIEAQCDERTTEIRKKMQQQAGLNNEIRKLQDQIRLANMSFDEVNSQEQQKKERLYGLDTDIGRKNDEIKNLEKKISDLQNHVMKEDSKLEKILKTNASELSQLKSDISEKLENRESVGNKINQVKKDAVIKEFTEQKIFELEEIIRQHEHNVDHYEQENRKLSNHLSVLNRDLAILRQNQQFELENKDKEMARLRKRVAKEIFQLEKLAEDQCSRANSLNDDLNQARRDYMLLRNRCLAQEHFIEQQNLLKEYLHPKSKFFPTWDPNPKNDGRDIPVDVETAIMAEHRRHLQNQLNLLKENIVSATKASEIGFVQNNSDSLNNSKAFDNNLKWNTASSGIGSTLDHTGNSSDTFLDNEKVKKALHFQFDDEVEKINTENLRNENLCRQLRSEVDYLKSSLPSDKSPTSFSE